MEYFTEHTIGELVEISKREREKYDNFTPLQAWNEIMQLTHLFRGIDGVDENQSKALYDIEEICSEQKDLIYFPNKKKR